MQTTLRVDDSIFREAKAEAARRGITLTKFIEEALLAQLESSQPDAELRKEAEERNRRFEELLQATAGFRIGPKPSRDEMNER